SRMHIWECACAALVETWNMTDTKQLLQKIAALRVRLDQAKQQTTAAPPHVPLKEAQALEDRVHVGSQQAALLDGALRQLGGEQTPALPPKLTARGARLLQRGRELLQQLRDMIEDPLLRADEHDPLTALHGESAAMLDVILRTVQAFPPAASAQLRLCEGLE